LARTLAIPFALVASPKLGLRLWEWFTKEGELKKNYMEVNQCGTTMKISKENSPKL
jgi:hypothetical protein